MCDIITVLGGTCNEANSNKNRNIENIQVIVLLLQYTYMYNTMIQKYKMAGRLVPVTNIYIKKSLSPILVFLMINTQQKRVEQ